MTCEQQLIAEAEKLNKQRTLGDQELAIAAARSIATKTNMLTDLKNGLVASKSLRTRL